VVQICFTNCIDVHDSKMKHFPLKVLNFLLKKDTEFSELALQIPGYESGNFVGPTILCDVTTSIECYRVYIISEFEYSLSD